MLEDHLHVQLNHFFSLYPGVKRAYLFGSRARGTNRERSDIDIAIEAPNMDRDTWLDLCHKIEDELHTLLEVDVVDLEKANEELKENIKQEGKLLYERKRSQTKNGKPS